MGAWQIWQRNRIPIASSLLEIAVASGAGLVEHGQGFAGSIQIGELDGGLESLGLLAHLHGVFGIVVVIGIGHVWLLD